ncbi:phage tail protein [Nitrosopumilus sp.]|uniref:phage tail protein n=1 Tax=Nitrosopumilus sp. TaxID=2024843 RepID=UPI00247DDD0C|nr:phage tail protein [Nitrosopumilus sp.]MCV0431148.1 phage tail protein [Nitrosopumilus sp.]
MKIFFLVFFGIILVSQSFILSYGQWTDYNEHDPGISQNVMPEWFKTNAKWWQDGLISDADMINALESLIEQDVIPLDNFLKDSSGIEHQAGVQKGGTFYIPSYQKDVFGFWSEGLVSDGEIVNSIGHLIGEGIIDSEIIREKRTSFSEISGLEIESPPIDYRSGSEDVSVTKMPGLKKYADITLKRGTVSAINEAQQWNKLASEMLFKLKDGEEKIHKKSYENSLLMYSESKTFEHLNQMLIYKEKSENAQSDALLAVENYKKIKELSELTEDEYLQIERDLPLEFDLEIIDSITNESEYFEALEKIQEFAENALRKAEESVIQLKQQADEEYPRTHPDFIWDPTYNYDSSLGTTSTGIKWIDLKLILDSNDQRDSTVKIRTPFLLERLFDPSIIQTHSMIEQLDENPFDSTYKLDSTDLYQYPEDVARILQSIIIIGPHDTSNFWLPVSFTTTVFISNSSIQIAIFDSDGNNISDFVEIMSNDDHQIIFLPAEHDLVFISLTNPNSDYTTFETAIEYSEITSNPELVMTPIDSPLIEFGTNTPLYEIPPGFDAVYSSFDDFSSAEFEYESEMSLMDYLKNEQLFFSECLLPPAGSTLSGPTPPEKSRHNANYCGISAFIHSMETTFPGALSHDIRTNSAQWDRLGDNLDHSNTFGERGGKFVENVNKNFGNKVITGNGKKYCAAEIEDTTPANLEAWNDICNVKMLVYDIPSFGHWVDLTSISGNKITYQDYGHNHPATFDGKVVDFSNSNLGGPMKDHFRGNNAKAGDGFFESVQFYAVCECDKNSSSKMPTKNSKGQTLKLE